MEKLIIHNGSRSGQHDYYRSSSEQVTFGRAFTNDLIVTDPYVAPRQLLFKYQDDNWYVEILDPTNPVYLNQQEITTATAKISSGDELTTGRTQVMLYLENHPVDETRKLILSRWVSHGIQSPLLTTSVLIIVFSFLLLGDFLHESGIFRWGTSLTDNFFPVIVSLIWAGIWYLTGRLVRHQRHFYMQWFLSLSAILLYLVLSSFASILDYQVNGDLFSIAISWIVPFIILSVLLKYNLMFATHVRQPAPIAMLVSGLIFSTLFSYVYIGEDEFQTEPDILFELLPPLFNWREGETVDEILSNISGLYERVDKE